MYNNPNQQVRPMYLNNAWFWSVVNSKKDEDDEEEETHIHIHTLQQSLER